MNLFGLSRKKTTATRLEGEGLYLRPAQDSDFEAWRDLREESRAFLTPWEPSWAPDELTRSAFLRRILRQDRERAEDESHGFFLFRASDDALLGGATLGNIRRGVSQTGTLGYWMGERHAGRGFMARAVKILLKHCFDDLKLHRIEAACAPENERSRRLLEKIGFTHEGFARAYLLIDGHWQDHLLFAILSSDGEGGRARKMIPD